jgi:tetratricopeptide (TPR) repeat protein
VLKKLLGELLLHAWRRPRGGAAPATGTLRERFDRLLLADDCDGALALARDALAREPGSYEALLLQGRARQKLHDAEGAMRDFDAALRLRPDDAELHDYLGALRQELGQLPAALAGYERALELRPDFPLAAFHRALARLTAGDFARGWDDYELRLLGAPAAAGGPPRWEGSPLAGRGILVAREQGLGDEIMFASMLPQLAAQAARCVVECDPRLLALFRRSFPSVSFFGSGAGGAPGPVDCAIEAGSLARHFRRRPEDFPRHEGYLRADPEAVARWRARLDALGPELKIGLSWQGGVRKTRRPLRSLELEELLPLLRLPGLRFVSLQYTPEARAEVDDLKARHGIAIEHWPEAIDDLDQTAALVCALDLVASVCTSLVHLAGALGRPAWVLTPVGPEWRYGSSGESMPWYPSVRLFRQGEYRQWAPVVEAVAAALREFASDRGAALAVAGRHQEAAEALRAAAAGGTVDAATVNLAGLCCTLTHRYAEAIALYERALAAEPGHADALLNAGWTATLAGSGTANRYFRAWLAQQPEPAYGGPAPSPERLRLPEVALACVDCAYHDLAAKALRTVLARCEFGRALFLSDRDCGVPGVQFVPIERIGSTAAYSNFMVHRLHEYVGGWGEATHVLVIQYDGFVLNPGAWDPAFLQYDYIGPAVRFPDGRAGGIGGFSLRSRRLLAALRDDAAVRGYDAAQAPFAEDVAISWVYRRRLEERHGVRFAPAEVADRFAAEAIAPTERSFGFHNLMHLVSLLQHGFRLRDRPGDGVPMTFRAASALGPVSVTRELELRARGDAWVRHPQAD